MMRWMRLVGSMVVCALFAGAARSFPIAQDDPSYLLKQADSIKSSDHAEFVKLLQRLGRQSAVLTLEQQWNLRYLDAWELAYTGNYESANPRLEEIIEKSPNPTLKFRALATSVNILGDSHRYLEAFERLSQMLDQLPTIGNKSVRYQGLGEASQLLIAAGQYDLASSYAEEMFGNLEPGESICKAMYLRFHSRYKSGAIQASDPEWQAGVNACADASESIFANSMRIDMAESYLRMNRANDAISLLQRHYAQVLYDQYVPVITGFDAQLAKAYLMVGDVTRAREFALDTIAAGYMSGLTKPLSVAYEVLYKIDKEHGSFQSALAWHEKYLLVDKGYLNDVSAKALAYQVVKQQVQAKKLEVETLGKQNQILQLQQALDKKASETSRLYIALLLSVLVFIGLWAYRIKRSQLRFMRLARRDGLTDIFNRQHFLNEAELQLQYCRRASRDACLVLIDLDHFKAINDTHGHAVGDRVLQCAVDACKAHLRSTDVFGRLGGEEFGILLPECSLEQVLTRADQLRAAIASATSDEDGPSIRISASFGVACSTRSGYELHLLLAHADEALYQAKREGRNRVRISDDGAEARHSAAVVSIERA